MNLSLYTDKHVKMVLKLALFLSLLFHTECAKVLVLSPGMTKSGIFVLDAIASELATRGHEVVNLVPDSEQYLKGRQGYQLYPSNDWWRGVVNGSIAFDWQALNAVEKFLYLMKLQKEICEFLMESKVLDLHKDSDVILGLVPVSCTFSISYSLHVPVVAVLPSAVNLPVLRAYGQHAPLAYVPQMDSRLTCEMSLLQRMKNLLIYIVGEVMMQIGYYATGDDFIRKYNVSDDVTLQEMIRKAALVIAQVDFALEYAHPVQPNVKIVGPLLPHTARTLDPDLESFMTAGDSSGVVLVSFGSVEVSGMRKRDTYEIMAKAFAKLPFKVIWKIKDSKGLPLGANTRTLPWIKQNDILGHPKTRAFVTHAGHNGMYEAAYHGVPMVTCPQWGDQFDNSARLVHRGLAVSVDLFDVDNLEETLSNAILTVTLDPSFAKRAKHVSRVIRSRKRTPREEAADWVEHVLAVRDLTHLQPMGTTMPIYQLYLLDVMAVIVLLVIAFGFVLKMCLKSCKKCFSGSSKIKTT